MQHVMKIKEAVVTDFSLEELFNELGCIMLQFAGLPIFWSLLFLRDAGMHLFWQCLVLGGGQVDYYEVLMKNKEN